MQERHYHRPSSSSEATGQAPTSNDGSAPRSMTASTLFPAACAIARVPQKVEKTSESGKWSAERREGKDREKGWVGWVGVWTWRGRYHSRMYVQEVYFSGSVKSRDGAPRGRSDIVLSGVVTVSMTASS